MEYGGAQVTREILAPAQWIMSRSALSRRPRGRSPTSGMRAVSSTSANPWASCKTSRTAPRRKGTSWSSSRLSVTFRPIASVRHTRAPADRRQGPHAQGAGRTDRRRRRRRQAGDRRSDRAAAVSTCSRATSGPGPRRDPRVQSPRLHFSSTCAGRSPSHRSRGDAGRRQTLPETVRNSSSTDRSTPTGSRGVRAARCRVRGHIGREDDGAGGPDAAAAAAS